MIVTGSRPVQARKYDIANTNIGGLGTNLEKAVRQAAAECEGEVCASSSSSKIFFTHDFSGRLPARPRASRSGELRRLRL